MKIAAFSPLLYVLSGCVSTNVEIPRDHPANPSAKTTPLAIASPLTSTAMGPSASEPEPTGHQHHGHGQHTPKDAAAMPSSSSNSPTPAPSAQGKATPAHEPASEVWTCPMHSNVAKSGPGQCPICGMNLVQRPADKGAH